MNLTEAMVHIADLEAEKEELTNQVGDLTVEKDGYLEYRKTNTLLRAEKKRRYTYAIANWPI